MRFADLDCVTVDASGTLIGLAGFLPGLERVLRRHGVERSLDEIEAASRTEFAHYRERALDGRNSESVAQIRRECCGIFLDALAAGLDIDSFLPDFLGSFRFEPERGAVEVLSDLRGRGLAIAVVSNWDYSLDETLEQLGLIELVDLVVTSAEVGAAKPDPRIFRYAIERLAATPERALHVGDEESDRAGALAAGMLFAPAPLATAFEGWT
ncbi:MAG: HAD-IA family hydrolase [Gaiellaceae bacterium]